MRLIFHVTINRYTLFGLYYWVKKEILPTVMFIGRIEEQLFAEFYRRKIVHHPSIASEQGPHFGLTSTVMLL